MQSKQLARPPADRRAQNLQTKRAYRLAKFSSVSGSISKPELRNLAKGAMLSWDSASVHLPVLEQDRTGQRRYTVVRLCVEVNPDALHWARSGLGQLPFRPPGDINRSGCGHQLGQNTVLQPVRTFKSGVR